MEAEPMHVTLNTHAAELLRAEQRRHPELSAAEIIEAALEANLRHTAQGGSQMCSAEELRAWLDELAIHSDQIPAMPGETFSREMIYQDHD